MNTRAWLQNKISTMEKAGLSEYGKGALFAFQECLEQVEARSPTDQEIDEVIDTSLRNDAPRYKVRKQLRALFGEGPKPLPKMTDEEILDHVPSPVLDGLGIMSRSFLCSWIRRVLRDGRLG